MGGNGGQGEAKKDRDSKWKGGKSRGVGCKIGGKQGRHERRGEGKQVFLCFFGYSLEHLSDDAVSLDTLDVLREGGEGVRRGMFHLCL